MTRQPQQSAAPQANLYPTRVDLPERGRVQVVQAINQALADTTDLQSQAKFAHWNVKGYDFYQLHLLFDELAETLTDHADLLAERATALGGQAMGTVRIAAAGSRVPEPPVNAVNEAEYLEWLTDHVGRHANALRANVDRIAELGDQDTADLFSELSRDVDKHLYFLESHLQSDVQARVPATPQGAGSPGTQTGVAQWTGGKPDPGGQQRPDSRGGASAREAAANTFQRSAGTGREATGRHPAATRYDHPAEQSRE